MIEVIIVPIKTPFKELDVSDDNVRVSLLLVNFSKLSLIIFIPNNEITIAPNIDRIVIITERVEVVNLFDFKLICKIN